MLHLPSLHDCRLYFKLCSVCSKLFISCATFLTGFSLRETRSIGNRFATDECHSSYMTVLYALKIVVQLIIW